MVEDTKKRELMDKYKKERSYHRRVFTQRTGKEIVCILLCLMSLIPFLILFVNATRTSGAIKAGISFIPGTNLLKNWANFQAKQNGMQLTVFKAMINSFCIAVPSTVLAVYVSTLTAYGIYVYDFRLKKFAWSFIMAVMIVPNTISIIGFYKFMLKLNLVDTYVPLIIPAAAAPATVFFMRQYMQSTFSKEIVEAARIDGCGEFRTFNTIAVPLMKPAIATQAIFCFVASWNNLFLPNMLLTTDAKKTLPLFVQMLRSDQFKTDYGVLYIGLAITILPIFIVYFVLSKYIVAGVQLGGVKE
jgi:multiple sugar transport system permease protein